MMKHPLFLQTWLDTATRGLCDDAKARITEDVVSHVDEAFDHLLQENYSANAAVQKAVEDLGDPDRARREFMRVHLTEQQSHFLDKTIGERAVQKSRRQRKWGIAILAIDMCYLGFHSSFEPPQEVSHPWIFALFVLILFFLGLWDPLLSKRKRTPEHLLFLGLMRDFLLFCLMILFFFVQFLKSQSSEYFFYVLFYGFILCRLDIEKLLLYLKLRRASKDCISRDNS